eukprot:8449460-Alexandrium_andersonii.AAC.1
MAAGRTECTCVSVLACSGPRQAASHRSRSHVGTATAKTPANQHQRGTSNANVRLCMPVRVHMSRDTCAQT